MNYRILVLMIFLGTFFFSCGDDNPTKPDNQVQIIRISPNSGKVDEEITITGLNFGIAQGSAFVSFNNVKATDIISWVENEIKLKVPKGAKSGKVTVTVNTIKSNEVDFTVLNPDPMESITIGSQTWMLRNLDVAFYRNSDTIRHAASIGDWIDAGENREGAWCYYNNDPAMGVVYGKLYNWYAVNDKRGLAPFGWHVPTDDEWTLLTDYLGGKEVAGGKMKEADTTHWLSPNTGGTNSSGFTALPGGYLQYDRFRSLSGNCILWSATEIDDNGSWNRYLVYIHTNLNRAPGYKVEGYSVRCVKD